jgi:hypothetical protein
MKMGVRRKRADCGHFGRAADAMIMAWTTASASMRVGTFPNPAEPQVSKGDPMKKSVTVYASLALLIAGISQATAQSGPSPQEKMACRSDAQTLCAEHIGKPPQMNACLRENKQKLSSACRQVVEARGG